MSQVANPCRHDPALYVPGLGCQECLVQSWPQGDAAGWTEIVKRDRMAATRAPARSPARRDLRARIFALWGAVATVAAVLVVISGAGSSTPGIIYRPYPYYPPLSTTTTTVPGGTAVCGQAILNSPYSSAPAPLGSTTNTQTVPAGNNGSVTTTPGGQNITENFSIQPNTTYWFTAGTHTLGSSGAEIQPANNDIFVGAPGAIISGNNTTIVGFAYNSFTGSSVGDTIEYLTIENFLPPQSGGVVALSAVAADANNLTEEYDTFTNNGYIASSPYGAGSMVSPGAFFEHNCYSYDGSYGVNATCPGAVNGTCNNLTISDNEFEFDGFAIFPDGGGNPYQCGCSGGIKFWVSNGTIFDNNYVHQNYNVGLWYDTDNTGALACGNTISDNWADGIIYEISYNAVFGDPTNGCAANTIADNAIGSAVAGIGGVLNLETAVYISESGGNAGVTTTYPSGYPSADQGTITIAGNVFANNWSGVAGYNNTSRLCGFELTGFCTLLSQTIASCTAAFGIASGGSPNYWALCPWQTQNLNVTGNTFSASQATINTMAQTLAPAYSGSLAYTANQIVAYDGFYYANISGTTPGQAPSGTATSNSFWYYGICLTATFCEMNGNYAFMAGSSWSTNVAGGSVGVNVSTFSGSQTLTVASTTGNWASATQISVPTSSGYAILSYTGVTSTTYTGVDLVSGTGTLLNTGGAVVNVNSGCSYPGGYPFTCNALSAATIQFTAGNTWTNNTYYGGLGTTSGTPSWNFLAYSQQNTSNPVNWTAWTGTLSTCAYTTFNCAGPFAEDAGSTINGNTGPYWSRAPGTIPS